MHTLGPLFNHLTIMNAFCWSFRLEVRQTGLSYLEGRFWFSASLYITYFSCVRLFKCMSRSISCQGPTMQNLWFRVIIKSSCCSQKPQHKQSFLLCSSPFKLLWNTPQNVNANADPPASCLTAAYKTDGEFSSQLCFILFFTSPAPDILVSLSFSRKDKISCLPC